MPVDIGFESAKMDSEFAVAPLATGAVANVKVKFSTPPPVEIALAVFRPEPLLDPVWRTPIPSAVRIAKEIPETGMPIVTRLSLSQPKTAAQRAEIAAMYPFLRAGEWRGMDSSDSGSSGAVRSYSGRRGDGTEDSPPPPEVRSLPGGRRSGSKSRGARL
jgi:hypothetical protein